MASAWRCGNGTARDAGGQVDTSLLAAVVGTHAFHGAGWLTTGTEPRRTGNRHPSIAPYGTFRCLDAELVIAVGSEALWRRFAAEVGLNPDRPDIATNADRVAVVDTLQSEIDEALSTQAAGDVLSRLQRAGIPAGRIRTLPEVYDWDQVDHLGLRHEMHHEALGTIRVLGPALTLNGTPMATSHPPPVLGDHDDRLDDISDYWGEDDVW